LYNNNPDWYTEKPPNETIRTRELKRTIVCCHPLEWDTTLYVENDKIKSEARTAFGVPNTTDGNNHFKNYVKATDIWEGLKGKTIAGLDLTKNSFWFAHPVYFVSHLEKAGLLNGSVIPIEGKYTMQGGDWADKYFPYMPKIDKNKISEQGCAVVLVANIAYTFGKTSITPSNIIENEGDFGRVDPNKGDLDWSAATKRLGLKCNNETDRVKNPFTIDKYVSLDNGKKECFIGLHVATGYDGDKADHWVGLVKPVVYQGVDGYIINPTSDNDSFNKQTENNFRYLKTGWKGLENGQTFVPMNRVKGYFVFWEY